MEEIQQIQFEIDECKVAFEKAYQEYKQGVKEYDKLAQKKKELMILYTNNRKIEEKKKSDEEAEEINEVRHLYKSIVKVLEKKERRGRPKKRNEHLIIDRCGIEVLKDPYLTTEKLKKYAKKNKIKRYTKMNKQELIKSLLSI